MNEKFGEKTLSEAIDILKKLMESNFIFAYSPLRDEAKECTKEVKQAIDTVLNFTDKSIEIFMERR